MKQYLTLFKAVLYEVQPAGHEKANAVAVGFGDWGSVHWPSHLNLHVLGVLARDEVEGIESVVQALGGAAPRGGANDDMEE